MIFKDLILAYLDERLHGRPSQPVMLRVAQPWILTLRETPTRRQVLERHRTKGHGDFQQGAVQANTELALIRAACRWGLYQERWTGGDPTVGIRKWKRPKRKRIVKLDEIRTLLRFFDCPVNDTQIRDRALFGLELFTGCRPGEARKARLGAITPYSEQMGCWQKGRTKTGETQEVPVPTQAMMWLRAWLTIRQVDDPHGNNPYLFPGYVDQKPLTETAVRIRWKELCEPLGIHGLWTYDLRRTLACYLSNELRYDDKTVRTILNHFDGTALGHYLFVSFDALTKPIQEYADWLCAVKDDSKTNTRRSEVPTAQQINGHTTRPIVELREAWHEYPG